jgi:hypothetical protein
MENISEYDERQLKLMYEFLISFEMKQIGLCTLVCKLESLFSVLESVEERWEEEFLTEVTTLETINAIEIIKDSGEEAAEIAEDEKERLINQSVVSLKKIIENKQRKKMLNDCGI